MLRRARARGAGAPPRVAAAVRRGALVGARSCGACVIVAARYAARRPDRSPARTSASRSHRSTRPSTGARGGRCCCPSRWRVVARVGTATSPSRERVAACCSSAPPSWPRAWAVALALLDGTAGLVGSVTLKNEYFPDVGRVGAPLEFLARVHRPHRASTASTCRGIPPATCCSCRSSTGIGLGIRSVVAALEIVGGTLAVPAVLVAVREVAGEATSPARRGRSSPRRRSRSGSRRAPTRSTPGSGRGRWRWSCSPPVGRDRRGDVLRRRGRPAVRR